jgi:glutamine amidotransferase
MSDSNVVIIDYNVGNLLSLQRAFEYCGAKVIITSNPVSILSARKIVLPGVGAFAYAMTELHRLGLDRVVKDAASQGALLLGICLGMQLLLDESQEFGTNPGLGLISGRVVSLPTLDIRGQNLKIPHIGWNSVQFNHGFKDWEGLPFKDSKSTDSYYFNHSYMSITKYKSNQIATCLYGGHEIPAVINYRNIIGCQFHPEKSGEAGLRILRRFISE